MGLAKRIIPCLDVDNGRVVKGTNFVDICDAGDPIEVAFNYDMQGADEICFLDITASHQGRGTTLDMVSKVASQVFIPLTVGGGVSKIEDIRALLNAGADKVAINTSAVTNPNFIKEASKYFGSQCIVVAIDAKLNEDKKSWNIYTHGGRKKTELDAISWAKKMANFGAGELLVTSMDRDGTRSGFDNNLISKIALSVDIPVIASGGVGSLQDLADGVVRGCADAVLAASIFHFGEYTLEEAKLYMQKLGIEVRL